MKEEIIKIVKNYIEHNWHASLGYGRDHEIYVLACQDLGWLLKPLDITLEEIESAPSQ